MIALCIIMGIVIPLMVCLALSFIPGRVRPGIHESPATRWVATWKLLFWVLIAIDVITFSSIPLIEHQEVIGYTLASLAMATGVAFGVVSFVVARYVGRQPIAWAICGFLSMFPTPAQLAFGVIGFIAIQRATSGPIRRSRLRVKLAVAAAIVFVAVSTAFLGVGQLLYEIVKNAKTYTLGINATNERILDVTKEVFREAGFTIDQGSLAGIVIAREAVTPSRYYEISLLGSRGGLAQLYVFHLDSKKSFWALPMEGGAEMLPVSGEARRLFTQVKARAEGVSGQHK